MMRARSCSDDDVRLRSAGFVPLRPIYRSLDRLIIQSPPSHTQSQVANLGSSQAPSASTKLSLIPVSFSIRLSPEVRDDDPREILIAQRKAQRPVIGRSSAESMRSVTATVNSTARAK